MQSELQLLINELVMSDDEAKVLELCNTVHEILQHATKNLPIPDSQQTRDVRKKISVFTYGVIIELATENKLNQDIVYANYLMMGGLSSKQSNTIVARTRDEFTQREFGEQCILSAKKVVTQWKSGNKNIGSLLEVLL